MIPLPRIGLVLLTLFASASCSNFDLVGQDNSSPEAPTIDAEIGEALLIGFDHLPVAVNDLDAAQTQFQALGFTIKRGRPHDNGIRNGHAKFGDGSYIELITAPAARDELTTLYRSHLLQGNGPAFLSLYVRDLEPLPDLLASLGGVATDGKVVFEGEALAPFFFGTRDRSPTDRPEHYIHANSAIAIDRVWLAPSDRHTVERMFTALGVQFAREEVCAVRCGPTSVAHLQQGSVLMLDASDQTVPGRMIIGATVRVESLASVRTALGAGEILIGEEGLWIRQDSILVPPALANGLWLEFRE